MRSELRRDMHTMLRNMLPSEVPAQAHHNSYQATATMVPQQQQPVAYYQQSSIPSMPTIVQPMTPMQQQPPSVQVVAPHPSENSNYMLPFIAGCAVSCIGLSYLGLMIFALLRGHTS